MIAVGELVFASSLWGFGFVAAVWALRVIDAFELTFLRFALAAMVGLPMLYFNVSKIPFKRFLRLSLIPALLLSGTLIFQTWGLQYTTATKCGFITTLYVVMVPMMESVHMRRNLQPSIWLCVLTAFLGTLLIVNVGLTGFNIGDGLTLICAILAAFQIYYIGLISPEIKLPFTFNVFQVVWSALICSPFLFHGNLIEELWNVRHWPGTAIVGVGSLAFGSTVIAFSLQVKAQAKLSPTISSLLFLLESPFAMLFALTILGEKLGWMESIGAGLILTAAVGATWIEANRKKKKG